MHTPSLRAFAFLAFAFSGCSDDAVEQRDLSTSDLSVSGHVHDMSASANDFALPPNTDMTGFQLIESCGFAQYIDATTNAALRVVSPWDTSLGTKCLRIKIGQTVSWSPAPDGEHPLEPTGGTKPTPIADQATATFTAQGIYGFRCTSHLSDMHGAIWVEP